MQIRLSNTLSQCLDTHKVAGMMRHLLFLRDIKLLRLRANTALFVKIIQNVLLIEGVQIFSTINFK